MRRKTEQQRFKSGHVVCRAEYQRFPHVYAWEPPSPTKCEQDARSAHLAGIKTRIKPTHRCLRDWFWIPETDLELELHAGDGKLLARLEHNRGRYRLTYPRTFPILSWPDSDPDLVKQRAESIALNALPLDPATAARVERDNARPHPMAVTPPVAVRTHGPRDRE